MTKRLSVAERLAADTRDLTLKSIADQSSWDRFLVPLPFSRGLFVYGDPIEVPAHADAETMERSRLALEQSLDSVTERADREA